MKVAHRQPADTIGVWVAGVCLCALSLPLLLADLESDREPSFVFVRIHFNLGGGPSYSWVWRGGPPWAHDYPRAEQNFLKILGEVTGIETHPQAYRIISLEEEELMRYPFAYMCEVGFLEMTDKEVENLRNYLNRGGFLVVDDFRGEREWNQFARQMARVFPDRVLEPLTLDHPIFHCFFDIKTLAMVPPYAEFLIPKFYGLSDDKGRLMMVVNYNNDIGDYWEWSDSEFTPIDLSNEAYKFGVNYVVYALTH